MNGARQQALFLQRIAYVDSLRWLVVPPGARASRLQPYSCKWPPIHYHSRAKYTKPAFTK